MRTLKKTVCLAFLCPVALAGCGKSSFGGANATAKPSANTGTSANDTAGVDAAGSGTGGSGVDASGSGPGGSGVDGKNSGPGGSGVDGNSSGPGGSGVDGNGSGPGGSTVDVAAVCGPSQKIAFVNCQPTGSATSSMNVVKGKFAIDVVDCSAVQANSNQLQAYDTIVYYGPLTAAGQFPASVSNQLVAGAKVVLLTTGACDGNPAVAGCGSTSWISGAPAAGLFFEDNLEFPETIGSANVTVVNPNGMANAFSTTTYGSYNINHLMRNTGGDWCSDLVVTSKDGARSTTFHGFLLDDSSRKGLLIATTLDFQKAGSFDFTEPFLAAHLSQLWSQPGNSAGCGLTCGKDGQPTFVDVTGMGKPVIYLYPEKPEDVYVKLDFDGKFVTTYPQYDETVHGWKVHARPDGQLTDRRDKREYSYIYWSGTTKAFKPSFDEGFVVKGEDTRKFLQDTLARMGMTPREYNDMIVYWLPYMENHRYNLISFAHDSYTNVAKMNIEPKPDALLRVFMTFKKLDQPVKVKPQKLEAFQRKGFTVVEWGGTEINGDWHVIH